MTKSFLLFLTLFVALGISIGGAFAGGVAFGRSQDNEASPSAPTLASASTFGGNFGQQPSAGAAQGTSAGAGLPENLAQLRQRIQSGEVSPEDLARLRQQFQSGDVSPEDLARLREQFGAGDASPEDQARLREGIGSENLSREEVEQMRQQFAGRSGGAVTGTVDTVDGNQVTVDTADGPRTVTIGLETVIQKSTTGTIEDLQQGVRIAAIGNLGTEEGGEARFVVLIPEGADGPFGEGFFGGRQGQDGGAEGFGERRFRRDGRSP